MIGDSEALESEAAMTRAPSSNSVCVQALDHALFLMERRGPDVRRLQVPVHHGVLVGVVLGGVLARGCQRAQRISPYR